MNAVSRALALGVMRTGLVTCLASCGTLCPERVDYRRFEKTPDPPSSVFWRAVSKSNPYSARRAFYGNWGGPGNEGGPPIDSMDEAFRRHDIVYQEARSIGCLCAADRELLRWLERLDEGCLDERARVYRERAVAFLTSPWARCVGKPVGSILRAREPAWSCFQSPEEVVRFFDPAGSGFPDVVAERDGFFCRLLGRGAARSR